MWVKMRPVSLGTSSCIAPGIWLARNAKCTRLRTLLNGLQFDAILPNGKGNATTITGFRCYLPNLKNELRPLCSASRSNRSSCSDVEDFLVTFP